MKKSSILGLLSWALVAAAPGHAATLREQLVLALSGDRALDRMREIARTDAQALAAEGIQVVAHRNQGDADESVQLRVKPALIMHGCSTGQVDMAETTPYKHFHALVFASFTGSLKTFAGKAGLTQGKPRKSPPVGAYNKVLPGPNDLCPVTLGATRLDQHHFVFGCGWCNGG